MSTLSLQQILDAVAAGSMTPEEASEQIAAMRAHTPPPDTSAAASAERGPVERIIIKGGAAKVVVIGDPLVAEAVAEGPHRMQRSGGDLLVTTNMAEGDYSTQAPRSVLLTWLTSVMDRVGGTLTVRVNPAIPLQVLVVGGALDITGVTGGAAVGIEAGGGRLENCSGPLQLDVVSGSARVDWTFTGESRIRADMGSAQVYVRPESDVSITAEATLGQATVKAHNGMFKATADGTTEPVLVGAGSGSLIATARMGSVQVTLA